MQVILSRKGFDDKYGGHPSIIWPDKRMLSFPIPVERPEQGDSPEKMFFDDKSLLEIFNELGFKKTPQECHLDPEIQNLTGEFTIGSLGQSGAAQGHLKNNGVGKDDLFLFFGTFSETYFDSNKLLKYKPMHPFHAIWGYLVVEEVLDTVQKIENSEFKEILKHPHYINRKLPEYKSGSCIYIGKDFGTFKFNEILRLTKPGYQKSYWSLPPEFIDENLTYNENKFVKMENDRAEGQSASKGQEFIAKNESGTLEKWIKQVLSCKVKSI
jgi:hypothetical protein